MGKINEIQEQVTQSFGNNSFTTKITDTTVEFDSARDSFTFKDPVEVPSINVGGTESVPFTAEEKAKLATVTTPMQIKGRVDTAAELPTEGVQVGDVYLVGVSGSENFEEYVCTEISGSPAEPVWECLGKAAEPQVQADWNQNDETAKDYIKNRICYEELQVFGRAQLDANASFGAGYFTNDCTPIVDGEMYDVTIGNETKTLEASSAGLAPGTVGINFPGFTNFGGTFNYNPSGVSGAPNNEKFAFYGGGDPTTWANAIVTISQSTIAPIDDKFIPDTVARVNDGVLTLGTLQLKDDSGLLGISSDNGTTFKPVSRAYNTYKDSSASSENRVVDFKSHKYFVSDGVESTARIQVVASDCNDDVLYEDSFNIFVSASRSVFTNLVDLVDTKRTGGLDKFTNVLSGNLSSGTYHVTIKYERISGTYKLGRLYVLFEQVYSF